jgi:hypothetical protein
VLARLTELRPDLQLLAVEELGLAATQVADAVWLRYQTALAAINQLQLKSPWLDSFAMVDFMEFAVARDPLAVSCSTRPAPPSPGGGVPTRAAGYPSGARWDAT